MGKAKRNRNAKAAARQSKEVIRADIITADIPAPSCIPSAPTLKIVPQRIEPSRNAIGWKPFNVKQWLIPTLTLIILSSSAMWWISKVNGMYLMKHGTYSVLKESPVRDQHAAPIISAPSISPTPPERIDSNEQIENRRHSFMRAPWNLNSDGNTWNNALDSDKRSLCISLANHDNPKTPEFYQDALDTFYNTPGPTTLNTKIIDALDQIEGN